MGMRDGVCKLICVRCGQGTRSVSTNDINYVNIIILSNREDYTLTVQSEAIQFPLPLPPTSLLIPVPPAAAPLPP